MNSIYLLPFMYYFKNTIHNDRGNEKELPPPIIIVFRANSFIE